MSCEALQIITRYYATGIGFASRSQFVVFINKILYIQNKPGGYYGRSKKRLL